MIVIVQLFASAREVAGEASIKVMLADSAKVSDLKSAISAQYPNLARIVSRSQVARNQEFAMDDEVVQSSDELAVIPPVSGG